MKLPPINILIVDDDPHVCAVLKMFTEEEFASAVMRMIHVDTALDGYSALSLLSTQRYDLVITDMMMPTLDGYELVERIRAGETDDRETGTRRDVPIVTMSAGTRQAPQADLHVVRPFSTEKLFREIAELLGLR